MFKICYIIGQLNRGGAERQLYELVKNIDKNIFHPAVISLSQGGYWGGEIKKLGIELIEINRNKNKEFIRLFKLMKMIKIIKPDIVHTYLFNGNSYGRIAAILMKVPVIIASERNLPERGKDKNIYQILIDKFLSLFSDAVICNSFKAAESLIGKYSYNVKKVFTIHNSIKVTDFMKNIDLNAPKKSNNKIIGTIGRLEPQKNYRLFLDMARLILEKTSNKDMNFMIVGKGRLRDELERYAARLGIEKNVIFTGERSDVPELLQSMDVFVMTSLYEGLSNAIMEAMLVEVPVIATDVGGNSELVVDGKTGFICRTNDAKLLAEKVLTLLNDENKAKRMGRNGKRRIKSEFGTEKMIESTERIYSELLKRNSLSSRKMSTAF